MRDNTTSKEPGSPGFKSRLDAVVVVTECSREGVHYKTISSIRQFPESLIRATPAPAGGGEEGQVDPKRSR